VTQEELYISLKLSLSLSSYTSVWLLLYSPNETISFWMQQELNHLLTVLYNTVYSFSHNRNGIFFNCTILLPNSNVGKIMEICNAHIGGVHMHSLKLSVFLNFLCRHGCFLFESSHQKNRSRTWTYFSWDIAKRKWYNSNQSFSISSVSLENNLTSRSPSLLRRSRSRGDIRPPTRRSQTAANDCIYCR